MNPRPRTPATSTHTGERSPALRDFLTDGSFVALCEAISALAGVRIEMRDEQGRPVRALPGGGWELLPARAHDVRIGAEAALVVHGTRIGSIVASESGDARTGEVLARVLPLLSEAASQWCAGYLELGSAIDDLGVLFELTAMLVGSTDVAAMVDRALESALSVLSLDAGSVVLLKEDADGIVSEDEGDLVLTAWRELSRWWLESPESLSEKRVFDRLALAGEVVAVPDLMEDSRVRIKDRAVQEGLRGFMCAGLVFRGRPIGVMRVYSRAPRAFRDLDRRLLRSIAQQAAAAVSQSRLLRRREQDRDAERQIKVAAAVQRRMLARSIPRCPGLDVAARYQPSYELGGDFYDVFGVGGRTALAIGDVAGKGVPAAMLMSAVRASLRAHADRGLAPEEVITRVNLDLCRDTLESEFATIWYGLIDPATGEVEYCAAGHEPPMLVRGGGVVDAADEHGMAAGILPDAPRTRAYARLERGDALLAYTDGVVDTMSFEGVRFGKDRLRRIAGEHLAAEPGASAQSLVERVMWEQRQFAGLRFRPDDLTLVAMRRM